MASEILRREDQLPSTSLVPHHIAVYGGGTFNNVAGNSYNSHMHTYSLSGCTVYLSGQEQSLRASAFPPLPSGGAGSAVRKSTTRYTGKRSRPYPSRKPGLPTSSSSKLPPEGPNLSPPLLRATNTLLLINKLVTPHAGRTGIFHQIADGFNELETLIAFTSTAYGACSGRKTMGKIIRAEIDNRMEQCNSALVQLHSEVVSLPHRSFPRIRQAYRVVHEWWTGNEPEEVSSIRTRVSNEVTAIGEWLRCLQSLWWASKQILSESSSFTMTELQDFLRSGPVSLLREVSIEEIIFLEPLQGHRRSIPRCFVKTFEDIHEAISMACRGTLASGFIEQREYQLDNPETDEAVDKVNVIRGIQECKEFDITILLSGFRAPPNACPRCDDLVEDEEENGNGWLRCRLCGMKFKGDIIPGASELQKMNFGQTTINVLGGRPDLANSTEQASPQGGPDHNEMARFFRRIQFEVDQPQPSQQLPSTNTQSNPDGDEKLYCFCNNIGYGEMIPCDEPSCEREWFHLHCTGLTHTPSGKWFCDECKSKRSPKRGARRSSRRKRV